MDLIDTGKLKMLLQLLFISNITYSQVGYLDSIFFADNYPDSLEFLINEGIYLDSIFDSLENIENSLNDFKSIQSEFDIKATNKTLNLQSYRKMSIFILNNEIESGYDFILKHATSYTVHSTYDIIAISNNTPTFVITDILKHRLSKFKKTTLFMKFILRSDFLLKDLNDDEMRLFKSIFSVQGGEEIINSIKKDKQKIASKKLILEAISNNY